MINRFKKAFRKDRLGTILLTLTLFFLSIDLITMPSFTSRAFFNNITNILSAISSISILVYILFRGKFVINYLSASMIAFVLYVFITSFVYKTNPLPMITVYSFIFLLFQFLINTKLNKWFLCVYILGTIVFAMIFYFDAIRTITSGESLHRLGSELANENSVGRQFMFGSAVILYVLLTLKNKTRFILLPILFLFALGTVLSGSRGSIVLLILVLFFELFFFTKKKKRLIFILVFAIFLIVGSVLFFTLPFLTVYSKRFIDLFSTLFNGSEPGSFDGSVLARIDMFIVGIELWTKRLITGWGFEGFLNNTSYGFYSHSDISEILCNFGLFGVIIKFIPFIQLLIMWSSKKANNHFRILLTPLLYVICFSSIFVVIFKDKYTLIPLCFIYSIDFITFGGNQNHISFSLKDKMIVVNNKNKKTLENYSEVSI